MLSFKNGEPFAKTINTRNPKVLHLIRDTSKVGINPEELYENPLDYLHELGFFNDVAHLPKYTYEELRRVILQKDGEVNDKEVMAYYEKAQNALAVNNGKAVYLDRTQGTFELLPPASDTRAKIFCAGSTGTGKTWWTCTYLVEYAKKFPKRPIVYITNNPMDKTIAQFKSQLGPNFVLLDIYEEDAPQEEEPQPSKKKRKKEVKHYTIEDMTYKDIGSGVIVFDDIKYIPDAQVKAAVIKLRKDCLGMGRHATDNDDEGGLSVICLAQELTDYQETKLILSECNYVVVFPMGGGKRAIDYYLKNYLHLENSDISKKITKANSRWAVIHSHSPNFCLTQNSCFLF